MNRKDLKTLEVFLREKGSEKALFFADKIARDLKPTKPSSRKAKGRGLQQSVCEVLSQHTGIAWGYDNQEIQPRLMGGSGTDIVLTGQARQAVPFDIECKNTETLSLMPTIEQAKANAEEDRHWLIVYKRNGLKPIVMLDMEVFFDLYFRSEET